MAINRITKRIIILLLSAVVLSSCHEVHYDYSLFSWRFVNESGHNLTIDMKSNLDEEFPREVTKDKPWDKFGAVPKKQGERPRVYSATITFEDGKVLKYSSKDADRSLCNLKCYEMPNGLYDDYVIYIFTLTEEDYALAVMPSEE